MNPMTRVFGSFAILCVIFIWMISGFFIDVESYGTIGAGIYIIGFFLLIRWFLTTAFYND